MEIGIKETTLGRCRNFVVAKFYLGGGDMKVATINISSVNLHAQESLRPVTDGDGWDRAADSTTNTTGDTNIKLIYMRARTHARTRALAQYGKE